MHPATTQYELKEMAKTSASFFGVKDVIFEETELKKRARNKRYH